MSQSTKADDFSVQLTGILDEYHSDVAKAIKENAEIIANELRDDISSASPKRTGKYQKGWTVQKVEYAAGQFEFVVHNKKEYRLTHLLENGHRNRGGGTVAARVHIKPSADKAQEKYLSQVKRIIENGG